MTHATPTPNIQSLSNIPEIGKFYTMSACKRASGDRSYIGHVWKVLSSNGNAICIQNMDESNWWGCEPQIVDVSEFDFTEATPHMVEVMTSKLNGDAKNRLEIYSKEVLESLESLLSIHGHPDDATVQAMQQLVDKVRNGKKAGE